MNWITILGVPERLITDGGSHFKNALVDSALTRLGTDRRTTMEYMPQTNGTIEIVNRSIKRLLRALVSEYHMHKQRWPQLIPQVTFVLNHTKTKRLCAPVELFPLRPRQGLLQHALDVDSGVHKTANVTQLTALTREVAEDI